MGASSSKTNTDKVSDDKKKDISLEVWQEYVQTRDLHLRNEIVLHYSDLVKFTAMRMRNIYKNYAQMDDVVNQGFIALIDAVEKFDPDRGIKFITFASIKVKGAVIDYIRSQDWIPRRLRKMAGDLEHTFNRLYSELGRQPTNAEVAKAMEITPQQLERVMEQTHSFHVLSYEDVVWQRMTGLGNEPAAGDSADSHPESRLMENELYQQLATSIDQLTERERTVISLYYYDNLKLREIAEVLGVSESRVCQIHSACILKMKKNMKSYITE